MEVSVSPKRCAQIAVVFLFSLCLSASDGTGALRGQVTDREGGAIPNAYVLIHWAGVPVSEGIRVPLESDGSFKATLQPRVYEIFVAAAGFAPTCTQVEVKEGKTTTYNARLRISRFNVID